MSYSKAVLEALIERLPSEITALLAQDDLKYDEPLSTHTTFKVGGPADLWIRPRGEAFPPIAVALLDLARTQGIPLFILGGGANLVVSDSGLRGIVLDTTGWTGCDFSPDEATAASGSVLIRAGTRVDDALEAAAREGWGGLEFLAGMPGTLGGAVWMNARCFDRQVSDVLLETEILDEKLNRISLFPGKGDFSYKKSPFQTRDVLILAARFRLQRREKLEIQGDMEKHRRDREEKGHYRFPSAGSAFKNNRDFGKPTGKIIDELGLRGLSVGGAQIAPWHGNFIINTGNARAADIRELTSLTAEKVKAALGIELEPEIIFVGDFNP
ncbi:UDP-N-acetylmuramate dehydrogenase [Treponema primitia ZAS-2]|uniref:UDP-N-acetylenolpyruvoylglucosamine reductase n=1 Tax=Treponema primitia (strain ATCC BAA-887 / DSM 12427 / ZAS-2) TaxID=545694 RepID=F5YKE0_TREPZ|nr:UDP-N-acetylmuramate dehydrogenase [Treponema primitia]AEF85161.1 UDP-N-acetylmuramate dehydrogenase [Treponema primitia ZAS-2]